jgi:hypothetical protein
MPVVVRTRTYDDAFIAEMHAGDGRPKDAAQAISELFET